MSAMAPPFTIRPGVPADAAEIASIFVETWRATYPGMLPDKVLVRMSDEAQSRYWARILGTGEPRDLVQVAAGADGKLAGFGSAGPGRHAGRSGDRREGEIYTLYVKPDWQNRGVGRKLICALLRGLAGRECRQAMLWVVAANPSRFFYEVMGGLRSYERIEKLWGMDVAQIGYRWPDLAQLFAEGGPCSRR
jgi:ribosomal protein S18 acetylase RimI-like enzyme